MWIPHSHAFIFLLTLLALFALQMAGGGESDSGGGGSRLAGDGFGEMVKRLHASYPDKAICVFVCCGWQCKR